MTHVFPIVKTDYKKEAMYYFTFVVEGRGEFPFDMLRYDRCFLVDGIMSNMHEGRAKTRCIKLGTWQDRAHWEPTTGRWGSFGWSIVPNHLQDR